MKRAEESREAERAGLYLGSLMNWTVRGRRRWGTLEDTRGPQGFESKDLPASYPTSALCPLGGGGDA